METATEVLAEEQKYFDHVSDHRERMRRRLLEAPAAAANAGAAARLRKDAEARLERLGGPDEAVAVGRMDDEDGFVLYVGHHTITDDEAEVLVVNWQAPAAARYYTATHADTAGLVLKRTFECAGNTIESYSDVVFRQLAAAVAELEAPDDALLDDLNRDRTGQMQDIVRTIQAAQFDLIRAPLDQLLIVQGGPGTGKTAVALHRVSWLLFNHRDTLSAADVLIVGPTPTFTRYTRTVLPSLGDISVVQRDIGQFHPPVRRGRTEGAGVVRLKGDGRLAGLLRRALYDRVGVTDDQPAVEAHLDGRPVVFTADEINQIVARSRQTPGSFTQQRQLFRTLMTNVGLDRARERRLGVRTSLDQLIERIWPTFTAAAFLRDLFGSRDRLIAAAGEAFTAREVALLHRRPSERITEEIWSEADLPLLDYLESLLHGIDERYAHIVVDEAQDLSPMQLRSIAVRSSTGSMTVVGDIAQSTGLWARDEWDDILEHLPAQLPQVTAELRYGYRVPRQVYELAERLLPIAAPGITAPQVVRDGPADPVFRLVDDESRAAVAVEAAMAHASHGRSVAIICPAVHRWAIESELAVRDVAWRAASRSELGQGVNLVSPQEAKGLEFDATVVVEPKDIIAEDERGHRLLYVALTRTTRYLHVVGVLPSLDAGAPELTAAPAYREWDHPADDYQTGHFDSAGAVGEFVPAEAVGSFDLAGASGGLVATESFDARPATAVGGLGTTETFDARPATAVGGLATTETFDALPATAVGGFGANETTGDAARGGAVSGLGPVETVGDLGIAAGARDPEVAGAVDVSGAAPAIGGVGRSETAAPGGAVHGFGSTGEVPVIGGRRDTSSRSDFEHARPASDFEVTRTITVGPAVGTATVPSPRVEVAGSPLTEAPVSPSATRVSPAAAPVSPAVAPNASTVAMGSPSATLFSPAVAVAAGAPVASAVALGTASAVPVAPVKAAPVRPGSLTAQIVELVAVELAGQVRENVQPAQWQAVLDRVGELLGGDQTS